MGLLVSKKLIDENCGEMTVSSNLGEGAIFEVKLYMPECKGDSIPMTDQPKVNATI